MPSARPDEITAGGEDSEEFYAFLFHELNSSRPLGVEEEVFVHVLSFGNSSGDLNSPYVVSQLFRTLNSELVSDLRDLRETIAGVWSMDSEEVQRIVTTTTWSHHVFTMLQLVDRYCTHLVAPATGCVLLQGNRGVSDVDYVVATLIQLKVDPSTRSVLGFLTLLEKEWIQHSYPFNTKRGTLDAVFFLCICCVHDMLSRSPHAFQFTCVLLHELCEALLSCRFGTFAFGAFQEYLAPSPPVPSFFQYILSSLPLHPGTSLLC